jgi:hypothetical protein
LNYDASSVCLSTPLYSKFTIAHHITLTASNAHIAELVAQPFPVTFTACPYSIWYRLSARIGYVMLFVGRYSGFCHAGRSSGSVGKQTPDQGDRSDVAAEMIPELWIQEM